MKVAWLLSVPVIALVALFAVRSAPTLAGPACANACGGIVADQAVMTTLYAGGSVYSGLPGSYCTDKTGGMIWVNSGGPTPSGVTCGGASATAAASAAASGTAAAGASAGATGTARAATSTAPAATSAPAATATATGTANPS